MFSSLYGDLPQAKDDDAEKQEAATPGAWSGQGLLKPPLKRPGLGSELRNEYDPARPNDYDQICRQREAQRAEAAAEAERQERLRELRELEELETRREEVQGSAAAAPVVGAGEARRAALHLSGEEAFLRRGGLAPGGAQPQFGAGLGGGLGSALGAHAPPGEEPAPQAKGMSLAQRMLEKMGWREGEGLGRNLQGMAAPLAVRKTDQRSGKIVAAEPARFSSAADAGAAGGAPARVALPPEAGAPTRVVLLRNVVGPGEVDESLDEEVGEECSKHGAVASVLIFEVTQPGFPPEEAVRIFVEFEAPDAAAAALRDMHGRFFGGRVVRGRFFDEAMYAVNDLAPRAGEVPVPP